jgi:hypothetical protein
VKEVKYGKGNEEDMNEEREQGRIEKAKVLHLWIGQVSGTVVGFRGSLGGFSGVPQSLQIVSSLTLTDAVENSVRYS